jgi:hypothetical protein
VSQTPTYPKKMQYSAERLKFPPKNTGSDALRRDINIKSLLNH